MIPNGWPGSPYLFDQSTFASFAHFEEFEEIPTHTKTMTTKNFFTTERKQEHALD